MSEHKQILIVDDDAVIRIALSKRLRKSGYDTVFAEDGVGAIAAVRKHVPDLILLDIGLPAGDGFMVLQRLQENPDFNSIPVIVLTARSAKEAERKVLDAGACAFFQKPPDSEELLSAIWSILGS